MKKLKNSVELQPCNTANHKDMKKHSLPGNGEQRAAGSTPSAPDARQHRNSAGKSRYHEARPHPHVPHSLPRQLARSVQAPGLPPFRCAAGLKCCRRASAGSPPTTSAANNVRDVSRLSTNFAEKKCKTQMTASSIFTLDDNPSGLYSCQIFS